MRAPKLSAYPTPAHVQVNDHIAAAMGVSAHTLEPLTCKLTKLSRAILAFSGPSQCDL